MTDELELPIEAQTIKLEPSVNAPGRWLGSMTIAGCSFHVEALDPESKDPIVQEVIDDFYGAEICTGGGFSQVWIGDHEVLLFIYPFSGGH